MDKIKTIKIKNEDGSISEETYTISVDAKNIDMDNGKDLQETIGTVNVSADGNIVEQLNKKIAILDIEDNLNSNYTNRPLSAKQGKILKDMIDTDTVKQLSKNTLINPVTGVVNGNGYSIISSTGQSFNNCIVNNAKLSFDNIATQTSDPTYSYYNAHVSFSNEVIFENCEFISTHVTRVDFRLNSKITFINCKFTNIYLHFSSDGNNIGPKIIKIKDCEFNQTINNDKETYGSTEYIHLTNGGYTLENCIIEGNIFRNSHNDCIDIYPSGSNILINGNTFTDCHATILELKMQKQDANVKDAKGVIISNNFFKNIDDNVHCIVVYNRDETGSDPQDLTLYPKITFNNDIFINERNNASTIACFYIYNTGVKTQISNCRTIGFNKVLNGKFIQSENCQINVDNCISQAPHFIFESAASNNSKMWISNCDALDDQVVDTIGSIRYVNELYISNCRFRYPNITETSNIIFMTNCKLSSKLQVSKGKYLITNCNLQGLTDNSVDSSRPYVCITNSITNNSITAQDWIILNNVKTFV